VTGRRLRLVRLCVSVAALLVLLGIQNFLVNLTETRFQAATRTGVLVVAALLGVVAIRDLVNLVVSRFHGPQAVIWRNFTAWTLYGLLALWLASTQSVNLSGLLVGGAIVGVVVATASQSSLGNFFAGLILMVAQPYRVGAAVRLRSAQVGGAEYEGTVIDQGALYTTLRGSSGEILKLPNSAVVTSALVLGTPPLQAGVDLELPAHAQVGMLLEVLRKRLGSAAVVSLEPHGFKAGDEDRLLCRLEVRSSSDLPPGDIAQALVEALDVASRSHVAA
jgi:Mechanosensitive ion channel